jgi:enediyne biosynthesis protein E5
MTTLNVKQWTILLLCILGIVGGYRYGYTNVAGQVIVSVLVTTALNLAFDYFRTKKIILSESAIITGLIISMVAAPNTNLLTIAIIAAIAIFSKQLIQIKKRTLFNPAAFSLLIGILFFQLPLSWWADSNHYLTIIAGSILLLTYSGHWKTIYAFLGTLTVLLTIRALLWHLPLADQLYLNLGISYFFTFFMLTDPKTSPMIGDEFIIYSVITAVGTFLSIVFHPSSIFLGGLLAANLATPYLNTLSLNKIKARTANKA